MKQFEGYGFLSFTRKCKKRLLDTGLDSLKTASKKVIHKTRELLGIKIADAVTMSKDDNIMKTQPIQRKLFHKNKEKKY